MASRELREWLETGLDWVYPPKCALCGRMGPRGLCDDCREEFIPLERTVQRLGPPSPLQSQASLFRYDGRARQAVRRLKYERATSIAPPMASMIASGALELGIMDWDVIVPVPIHWRRRCERGFNQSELLAAALPKRQVRSDLLKRTRATRPQVGLSISQRLQNLRGAFQASAQAAGRRVALLDDVLTSGGTATACAHALLAAGAEEVCVFTFAGWGSAAPDVTA